MNRLRFLLLILITLGFVACDNNDEEELGGRDVSVQFVNEYNGSYVEATSRKDGGERITIGREGELEILKIRDVGEDNNPAIPAGTICSYTIFGQINYVVELNEESRQRVDKNGVVYYSPQTHNMVFTVNNISLTDILHKSTTETSGCQNFEEIMNERQPVFSYGLELFGAGTIRLHTTGNDDFVDGERGDGTLDEVFERE